MFLRRVDRSQFCDLSSELSDDQDWSPGLLRTLEYHLDTSAFAIEPVSGLLAIGALQVARDWRYSEVIQL